MKMIKPIVNISRIMDSFDVVLCGFNGVLYDGNSIKTEAINALIRLKKNGKKIVLLSNTAMRLQQLINLMYENQVSPLLFDNIVTMGEVLYYKLQSTDAKFKSLGKVYYNLCGDEENKVFSDLGFSSTENYSQADFLYVDHSSQLGEVSNFTDILSHCVGLDIPMLCIGAETSAFINGEILPAAGAFAEQYATLGGKIILLGKPDTNMAKYTLENISFDETSRVLVVGDSVPVDIKMANACSFSSLLISKGIHKSYLGEGYIPDVSKTRELSTNFETFPDYVISNLRW